MLLNILVKVLDINDANDVIKNGNVTKNVARPDVLWRHKIVSTERHISNAYKEDNLVSNKVLCYSEVKSVFVTVLHLEYPQMGLNLLPEHI